MAVFVWRSVKDRPAAPCLSKKHTTEHPTTFFALSRQGLTHTHTFFPQAASFYTHLFHRLPFKGKTLSPTHTHPFHTQHFHTQLCHTQLCHTQTCDTQLGHTNLSHTHTQLCHIHLLNLSNHHHALCFSCLLCTASTAVSDYWKKLTCGVIQTFNFLPSVRFHFSLAMRSSRGPRLATFWDKMAKSEVWELTPEEDIYQWNLGLHRVSASVGP
jgi:hypothetical protein